MLYVPTLVNSHGDQNWILCSPHIAEILLKIIEVFKPLLKNKVVIMGWMNSYFEGAKELCFAWTEADPNWFFFAAFVGIDIYIKKLWAWILMASIYGPPLLCTDLELDGKMKISEFWFDLDILFKKLNLSLLRIAWN